MSRALLPQGLVSRPCPDHSEPVCPVCDGTRRVWTWPCIGCGGRGTQWHDGFMHICDECGGIGRHTGAHPEEY